MSKQRSGKTFEKRMAHLMDAQHIERNNYGVPAPDLINDHIVGECKLRETLALENWMQQVETHSQPHSTCVVIAKQKRLNDDKAIVCMRITDFLKLMDSIHKI